MLHITNESSFKPHDSYPSALISYLQFSIGHKPWNPSPIVSFSGRQCTTRIYKTNKLIVCNMHNGFVFNSNQTMKSIRYKLKLSVCSLHRMQTIIFHKKFETKNLFSNYFLLFVFSFENWYWWWLLHEGISFGSLIKVIFEWKAQIKFNKTEWLNGLVYIFIICQRYVDVDSFMITISLMHRPFSQHHITLWFIKVCAQCTVHRQHENGFLDPEVNYAFTHVGTQLQRGPQSTISTAYFHLSSYYMP